MNLLENVLNKYQFNDTLELYSELFEYNQVYNFIIKRCNFLFACSSTNHQLVILDKIYSGTPSVKIFGNNQRMIMKKDWLELKAKAYVASCNGTSFYQIDNIHFKWSINKNNLYPISLKSTSNDPSIFRLSSYSLESNSIYYITVVCSRDNQTYTSSSSVSVSIETGDIHAIINLGNDFTIRKNDSGIIDGSNSYDDDQNPLLFKGINAGLFYYWSCHIRNFPSKSLTSNNDNSNSNSNTQHLKQQQCHDRLILPSSYNMDTKLESFIFTALDEGEYIFELVLYDPIYSRIDTKSIIVTVIPIDYPSINIPISTLSNIDLSSRLKLNAIGKINEYTTYIWSSSPSLINKALDSPDSSNINVNKLTNIQIPLRLDTNVLYAHTKYTFTISISYSNNRKTEASIYVITNGPPILGTVKVIPTYGIELITQFSFNSLNWEDDDLPLFYSYGHYTINHEEILLQIRSEENTGKFYFSAGNINDNNKLTYFIEIYDRLGLNTTITGIINVESLDSITTNDIISRHLRESNNIIDINNLIIDKRLELIRNFSNTNIFDNNLKTLSSMEAIQKISFISTIISTLNRVDCTLPNNIINCNYLNRTECSKTYQTCGKCFNGYYGEKGDANTPCIHHLDNQNILLKLKKSCPGNCSNHGICKIYNKLEFNNSTYATTTTTITTTAFDNKNDCHVDDTSCNVKCKCNINWYGQACHLNYIDYMERQNHRDILFNAFTLIDEKFGDLELLLPEGSQLVLSTGPTVRRLNYKLRNLNDDDYLLLIYFFLKYKNS